MSPTDPKDVSFEPDAVAQRLASEAPAAPAPAPQAVPAPAPVSAGASGGWGDVPAVSTAPDLTEAPEQYAPAARVAQAPAAEMAPVSLQFGTTQMKIADPEATRRVDEITNKIENKLKASLDADAAKSQADAELERTKFEALAAQREEKKLAEQALFAKNQARVDELQARKIDPDRMWKNKSTEDKITAGIAILLGAVAQGYGAKANYAADAIQTNIERDIDAQKADIQNGLSGARMQESALAELVRQNDADLKFDEKAMAAGAFNSLDLATHTLKASAYGKYAAKLDAYSKAAAAKGNTATAEKAALNAEQLRLKQAENLQALNTKTVAMETKPVEKWTLAKAPEDVRKPLQEASVNLKAAVGFRDFVRDSAKQFGVGPAGIAAAKTALKMENASEAQLKTRLLDAAIARAQSFGGVMTMEDLKTAREVVGSMFDNPEAALARAQTNLESSGRNYNSRLQNVQNTMQVGEIPGYTPYAGSDKKLPEGLKPATPKR